MGRKYFLATLLSLSLSVTVLLSGSASAQLKPNYYANVCPDVENIVRRAVTAKFKQTFVTVPALIRLFFHDCFVSSGGPMYTVELGRLDGLSSTAASVNGNLPQPGFNLNQLNAMFGSRGLSQEDMIALSACHTVGFSHCSKFSNRIYNFSRQNPVDPTLNPQYATQLQGMCPIKVDPRIAINMDPTSPRTFDNAYFQNLVQGKGLFTSDQVLFTDTRSRNTVSTWASNSGAFNASFIQAITKLGRVGVKTGRDGNIRIDCGTFN
ncbi:peroxidase [Striga asiatica]|uniref:peroxidase n=1 Tax=Striga asiatica TaxID=4170 RepID=A0A5A7PE49_STRAF|nr:peroxidase [Striga asiatica]